MTKRMSPPGGVSVPPPEGSARRVARGRKAKPPPTKKYKKGGRPFVVKYRCDADEWKMARYMAAAHGFPDLSSYLRGLVELDFEIAMRAKPVKGEPLPNKVGGAPQEG